MPPNTACTRLALRTANSSVACPRRFGTARGTLVTRTARGTLVTKWTTLVRLRVLVVWEGVMSRKAGLDALGTGPLHHLIVGGSSDAGLSRRTRTSRRLVEHLRFRWAFDNRKARDASGELGAGTRSLHFVRCKA